MGELLGRGLRILSDRQNWELRQRRYYIMRREGLRRRRLPFPNAADLHLRLIDQKVTQKAAFTQAMVFGRPQLSTFSSLKPQEAELTQAANQYHDWQINHRTNFIRVFQGMSDTMWLRGRGIIKCFIDPYDDYKIIMEQVDPLWLLMPDDVNGFEDAYEWIHVKNIPVQRFKQERRYCLEYRDDNGKINEGTMKKLCGGQDGLARLKGQPGQYGLEEVELDKEYITGYLHSSTSDTVVLWEHYIRTMGGIVCYTYSPIAMDVVVRKPYGVPYKVNGRVSAPFFGFQAEVTGDGWYSARGVAEKVADMEIYGSKVWNAKADSITFLSTPMFLSEVGVQNPGNYRMTPGEVLPPGVKPAIFGQPPVSLDQEINFARGEAELDAGAPDIGIEKPNQRGNEKRTAKEVQAATSIAQIQMTGENTTIKDDLAKLFNHTWGLMLQYKRKELTYFVSDDLKVLPESALHDSYLITAGGATDEWDKAQRLQKAQSRYQLLFGKPNIDQDELVRELLDADDARLSKTLVIPQNQRAMDEAEDETQEIVSMMVTHYPAPVKQQEDHFTRAKTLIQFLASQDQKAVPIDPLAKQRLFQHLQAHLQLLKKMNPQQYKQLEQAIQQHGQQQQRPMVQPMPRRMIGRRPIVRPQLQRPAGQLAMV